MQYLWSTLKVHCLRLNPAILWLQLAKLFKIDTLIIQIISKHIKITENYVINTSCSWCPLFQINLIFIGPWTTFRMRWIQEFPSLRNATRHRLQSNLPNQWVIQQQFNKRKKKTSVHITCEVMLSDRPTTSIPFLRSLAAVAEGPSSLPSSFVSPVPGGGFDFSCSIPANIASFVALKLFIKLDCSF